LPPEQAGAHSGEFETALMLTVRPDLGAMDDAQPDYVGYQLSTAALVFEKGFKTCDIQFFVVLVFPISLNSWHR
jgi:hypothetical protein